jgi:hypothetical protein
VQALVIPLFLNCDVVFSQSSTDVNRRLNIAYNSQRIKGVSYDTFMDLRKFMMIYCVLNGEAPGYLCDRVRRTRSTRTMKLIVPNYANYHSSKCCVIQGVWPDCKLSCALVDYYYDHYCYFFLIFVFFFTQN